MGSKRKTETKIELEAIKDLPEVKRIEIELLPNGEAILPDRTAEGQYIRYVKDVPGVELEPAVKSFSPYIPGPPQTQKQLYSKACANDGITIDSWKDQWISQTKANNDKYDFISDSVMAVAKKEALKPVIVAGAGPSLRKNAHFLKPNWTKRIYPTGPKWELYGGKGDIAIVSCLHNFNYFEDMGVMGENDYYITLDAGDITIKEIYEGGRHGEDWYWERTKDRTLLAFTATHPELLEKWQGRILWYTTPPNPGTAGPLKDIIDCSKIPPFNVGGNVLGAALYMARAILGCGSVITIGADFSFSKERKFHGWDSRYDQMFSGVSPAIDVYGDRVYTYPSYYNFKCWFDYMACGGASNTMHNWINCTEGGILGAYTDGNIQQIRQEKLKDVLASFAAYRDLENAMGANDGLPRLLF